MTNDLFIKYEKIIYYVLRKLNLYNERDVYYDIGLIGLVKAGNTYDSSKGFEFSTYACSVIRSEILSYIRNQNSYKRKCNQNTIPLDKVVYREKNNEITLVETLQSDINIEEQILKNEEIELLNINLMKLNEKELFVINHYFGLNGYSILNQSKIAELLGVKQSCVSRIKNRAIMKLSELMK